MLLNSLDKQENFHESDVGIESFPTSVAWILKGWACGAAANDSHDGGGGKTGCLALYLMGYDAMRILRESILTER